MVHIAQVEFRKDRGMRERLKRGTKWNGVLILNGDGVQLPVIYIRPQAAVLLSHKEEARGNRGGGQPYDAWGHGLRNIIVHCLLLGDGEVV